MGERVREREDKYDVEPGWALPDVRAALPPGAGVRESSVALCSVYLDTADGALLAGGVTLRRRTGDADVGWQLKVPAAGARTEIRVPLEDPESLRVPAELLDLTAGLRAGAGVAPVARIDTRRHRQRAVDATGALLAELADDDVTATVPGDTARVARWRELEVELGPAGDETLLAELGGLLTGAGARRAAGPSKLARALGADVPPAPTPLRTVGDAVRRTLDEQRARILAGDLQLRLGGAPVHRTRVAVRRYRSVLRVFGRVLEPRAAQALDAELRWYAGVLGEVRDREVLRAHLAGRVAALPPELVLGPVAARIESHLLAAQTQARVELDAVLRGERYAALVAALRRWHDDPPFTGGADAGAAELQKYLRRARRRARRRLEAVHAHPTDETIHRARKAAKRLRYTGELTRPALGRPAKRVARRAERLQDLLGTHQDSVVARELLRHLGAVAGTTPGENGFTYGLLYAAEQQRAADSCRRVAALLRS